MRRLAALLLAACVLAAPARADEDADLLRIPDAAPAASASPATDTKKQNYIENAFTGAARRGSLVVPYPPPPPGTWENRLFLDSRDEWALTDALALSYSGRFNLQVGDGIAFPTHHNVTNDLRELYVSWRPAPETWIDLGRVNLKSGVAMGFNPTDFFRSRAVVQPLTADPSVLREDRLGTLMVAGQKLWKGASVTAAFAPRVILPTAIYTPATLPSFDPMLDRTNATDRMFLKASADVTEGLSPELLFYRAANRTTLGANVSYPIGQQVIAYGEWAGGNRATMPHDAVVYGVRTRTLPQSALLLVPDDGATRFRNDVAVGFSFTPAGTNITLNAEYHYHQAALTRNQWNAWFATGSAMPAVSGALWYVRGYSLDQQDPAAQQEVFLRASWTDAFVRDLNLTALATVNAQDGSIVAQATADYFISRNWTVGVLGSVSAGGRRTEYGSLPQSVSGLARVLRYF